MRTTPEIAWEDPPAPLRRYGPAAGVQYQDRKSWVAQLVANPGKWARWTGTTARAAQLAAELRRDFPGVEAVARYGGVWARWAP